ncbi:MAG TPA: non-homologous end-joining DNA ligase [Vicinamibacteria bacterium]|nr:non-homologous end-joining DNA ligase [Vicinamibacteria bacterium]
MLAGTSAPFDSAAHLFEIKWDGIRALAFFGPGVARLQGRKLGDSSNRYPEIVAGIAKLPGSGILDGEIVVLDEDGRPSFQRVLVREQTARREDALIKSRKHPVVYIVFDLLYRNARALFELPLIERKNLLSELLASPPSPLVENAFVLGQGRALYQQATDKCLEGVVAKRLGSRYLPGERTRDWLNLKVRRTTDGVLVGLVRDRGGGRVKSLVLASHEEGALVWLGNVGSGLDQDTLSQLGTELETIETQRPAVLAEGPGVIQWLEPRLVVRVEYSELTNDGRLRHPVFLGFVQRSPEDCLKPSR